MPYWPSKKNTAILLENGPAPSSIPWGAASLVIFMGPVGDISGSCSPLSVSSSPNAIDNWFLPVHNGTVNTKLTLDKAGRVVLPKPLPDRLQLAPGDTLHLESEGERITLPPVRQNVLLKNELGVSVYQGEPTDASLADLINRYR